jgi:signal transduction histidine kinase
VTSRLAPPRGTRVEASLLCLTAVLIGVAAGTQFQSALLLTAAGAALALGFGRAHATVRWTALVAVAAATITLSLERWPAPLPAPSKLDPEVALNEAQGRCQRLVEELLSAARNAARDPSIPAALAGDPLAQARVFERLETIRSHSGSPGLALLRPDLGPVAWGGGIHELTGFQTLLPLRSDTVVVLDGNVSTSFLALVPLRTAQGLTGVVVAERPVASRRNLPSRFLQDFDELMGELRGLQVDYADVREPEPVPAPAGAPGRQRFLRGPDGRVLAVVTARTALPAVPSTERPARRFVLGLLASLPFLCALWALSARGLLWSFQTLTLCVALRALWCLSGAPWPDPNADLLRPEIYGTTLLAPLLGSALDMLLTLAVVAAACATFAWAALRRGSTTPGLLRLWLCGLLALSATVGVFWGLQALSAQSALPVHVFSLPPFDGSQLLLQIGLFLWLAAGLAVLVGLWAFGGPFPSRGWQRLLLIVGWLAASVLAAQAWPRAEFGLPLVPALGLVGLAFLLATSRARWQPWLAASGVHTQAALSLALAALLGVILQPSLAHYAEKALRGRMLHEDLRLLLNQPEWQAYVLDQACRRVDALELLEQEQSGTPPPDTQQLAFAVWSATDLAAFGVSSAVELFDPSGQVISRFALNLPSLPQIRVAPASSAGWTVTRDQLSLGSSARDVLHAMRRLEYHGQMQGVVHLYVAEDYAALPFLPQHDPYAPLYRPERPQPASHPDLALLVYEPDLAVRFSSAEQPPALPPALVARLHDSPDGLWTTLPLDGRQHHIFLLQTTRGRIYGLGYPRLDAGRFAADMLDAAATFLIMAVVPLLAVLVWRSLLGYRGLSLGSLSEAVARRFALRLFVAFVALAIVPVVVLQTVVRRFVSERLRQEAEEQALQRANVAQKAVEDFVVFQHEQSREPQPVNDPALLWIASLVRGDLDVFDGGRLRATSRRELYASGLLPPRVDGMLQRRLVLEGAPRIVSTNQIGDFVYRMVSVPVHLGGRVPGILSVPLEERPQQLGHVLDDLDRTLRIASALFLLAAALLAQSMARRISGPLREVTQATRRVAAGDLETRVHTASRDELRELVDSFNQMAANLARQRHDLERSNRLAAWAEMARQVAHEVKNPLTPIQLSAEHLRRVYADSRADFPQALETCTLTILRQVRVLRDMVTEFSAFARPPAADLTPVDIADLIQESLAPYREALPPAVALEVECSPGLPPVVGDRRLLERALVNLIENALQALAGRGLVSVRAWLEDAQIAVSVHDSGPGVDPALVGRIFEPFFSTKTGGSGLGLALVKKIVEDHGGSVALESHPGDTRVVIRLPAEAALPAAETSSSQP